jgi:hypothetical protein
MPRVSMAFEHEHQILLFRSLRPLRQFFLFLCLDTFGGAMVGLVTILLKHTLFIAII